MTKDEKEKIQKSLEEAKKQILGLQDHIQNLERKLDECEEREIPDYPVFNFEDAYRMNDDLNASLAIKAFCMNNPAIKIEGYNFFHTKNGTAVRRQVQADCNVDAL